MVDKKGTVILEPNNLLYFQVDVASRFVGMKRDRPLSHRSVKAIQGTAFEDKCLALFDPHAWLEM